MPFNVVNYSKSMVISGVLNNIAWMNIPAPTLGRIVRIAITQPAGTIDPTDTIVDLFSAAAAGYAAYSAVPPGSVPADFVANSFQIVPTLILPGGSTNLVTFPNQFYANEDGDNVNRGYNGIYARINTQEPTSKTITIKITVETER